MSRGKQLTKAEKRRRRGQSPQTSAETFDALIRDTARVFTCALETAEDCATECERRRGDVDADLAYRRLAHDLWRERPGHVQTLAAAMADLITENERHRHAITALGRRFDTLAAQEDLHEHLDSPEHYYDLVRTRLFETPPAS